MTEGIDRGDENDVPAIALAHRIDNRGCYVKRAIEIDGDFPFPDITIDLIQSFTAGKASIVNQNIRSAMIRDETNDGFLDLSPVRQIEHKPMRERNLLQGLPVLIGSGHNRTGSSERSDQCPANPAASTGNEHVPIFQAKELVQIC